MPQVSACFQCGTGRPVAQVYAAPPSAFKRRAWPAWALALLLVPLALAAAFLYGRAHRETEQRAMAQKLLHDLRSRSLTNTNSKAGMELAMPGEDNPISPADAPLDPNAPATPFVKLRIIRENGVFSVQNLSSVPLSGLKLQAKSREWFKLHGETDLMVLNIYKTIPPGGYFGGLLEVPYYDMIDIRITRDGRDIPFVAEYKYAGELPIVSEQLAPPDRSGADAKRKGYFSQ